jgi:hypothetical protein
MDSPSFGDLVMAEGDTAAAVKGGDRAKIEARAQTEADLAADYEARPGGSADLDRHAAAWQAAYADAHPAPATWAEPDRYQEVQVAPERVVESYQQAELEHEAEAG